MKWLVDIKIRLKGGETRLLKEALDWLSQRSTWTAIVTLLALLGINEADTEVIEIGSLVTATAVQVYNMIRKE